MRRSTTIRVSTWRNDPPPAGVVLEVWYYNVIILAIWNDHVWRTVDTSQPLANVTHWRKRA
jgi:hypothetical protein